MYRLNSDKLGLSTDFSKGEMCLFVPIRVSFDSPPTIKLNRTSREES